MATMLCDLSRFIFSNQAIAFSGLPTIWRLSCKRVPPLIAIRIKYNATKMSNWRFLRLPPIPMIDQPKTQLIHTNRGRSLIRALGWHGISSRKHAQNKHKDSNVACNGNQHTSKGGIVFAMEASSTLMTDYQLEPKAPEEFPVHRDTMPSGQLSLL